MFGAHGASLRRMCLTSKPPPCERCMFLVAPCSMHMVSSPGSMCLTFECWNAFFFAFLDVCFYVSCPGSWEHNSSLCKVFRPLESSFFIIPRTTQSSNVFADLHDFFVNFTKNTLKLLCFGKNRTTYSNIENITKVPKS